MGVAVWESPGRFASFPFGAGEGGGGTLKKGQALHPIKHQPRATNGARFVRMMFEGNPFGLDRALAPVTPRGPTTTQKKSMVCLGNL